MLNPLTASLPEPFVVPLNQIPELAPTLELLFAEASSELPGRQAALDRLFEYVLVLLMRFSLKGHLIDGGVLSGLADERLGRRSSFCINTLNLPGRWINLRKESVCHEPASPRVSDISLESPHSTI
jgi:hypothetical protein